MKNDSQTPFTDDFFRVERRVTHFTLGGAPTDIFDHFEELDLSNGDCCRLLEATNIEVRNANWRIGIFSEPVAVCGQLYPKGTVVVFQDKKPGSRFTLFSMERVDSPCWKQAKELYSMEFMLPNGKETELTFAAKKHRSADIAVDWAASDKQQRAIEINGEFYTVHEVEYRNIVNSCCAGFVFEGRVDSDEMNRKPFNESGYASTVVSY